MEREREGGKNPPRKKMGYRVFPDVNSIGWPKVATSIPIFLGHYRQLFLVRENGHFLCRSVCYASKDHYTFLKVSWFILSSLMLIFMTMHYSSVFFINYSPYWRTWSDVSRCTRSQEIHAQTWSEACLGLQIQHSESLHLQIWKTKNNFVIISKL